MRLLEKTEGLIPGRPSTMDPESSTFVALNKFKEKSNVVTNAASGSKTEYGRDMSFVTAII